MEEIIPYQRQYLPTLIFIALSFLLLNLLKSFRKIATKNKLPPGPFPLPIIGHLHHISQPVHRTLERISHCYGPVVFLSFGSCPVLVVSSPSAVQECFGKNDLIFANRPQFESWKELFYNFKTMGAASYGPLWRSLRRVAAHEIFSTSRMSSYLGIRQEEVMILVKNLHHTVAECGGVLRVEMRMRLRELTYNIMMRMVCGKRYFGTDVKNVNEAIMFKRIVADTLRLLTLSDPGNFVPMLRRLGFGKQLRKEFAELKTRQDMLLEGLIAEHRNRSTAKRRNDQTKTIMDVMLELQSSEPEKFPDDIIKGMIFTLVTAGTETSSATLEWAISLLLNNPATLAKLCAELDQCIGHDRMIHEHDIHHLPYLQNIINETLRLFPPTPLLLPHLSSSDATVQGYNVPRGTMIMVNVWAIQRDPTLWDDPTSFRPERFEGLDQSNYYGHRLLPFGEGRRACPGDRMALKVVSLSLGALIQCFEWERVCMDLIDLKEEAGLAMYKAEPLEVVCKSKKSKITSQLCQY